MEDGLMKEEDAMIKELEDLRAENKILRDSLVEVHHEEAKDEGTGIEYVFRQIGGLLSTTADLAKEYLRPGTDKITETLSRKMEDNPVPLLLAVFGAGYLTGRGLDRK